MLSFTSGYKFKAAFLTTVLLIPMTFTSFAMNSAYVINSNGSIYYPLREGFGVLGRVEDNPAINNLLWLFGNESITYRTMTPSDVQSTADVNRFDGLVIWSKQGGYDTNAIIQYSQTHVVISDLLDFCSVIYPSLASSLETVNVSTMNYVVDWGNFHSGDLVGVRNETGNSTQLYGVLASGLTVFSNVSVLARFDANHVAFFHMNGTVPNSGFYVMDLDVTTPETLWTGIWHVFPAVKMVQDFPTGRYARWMANGQKWWDLPWIYNQIDTIVNNNTDIAQKLVLGKSAGGRNITAILIGTGIKNIIIDGAIHGNEKSPAFALLELAKVLIGKYRFDPTWNSRLLSQWKILIIPVLNPDGFATNGRGNANGIDLNRQFPPGANTTQPEVWALRNLMGNYTPTAYINLHEGFYWYPNWMIYGNYETDPNRTATMNAMKIANQTFTSLSHYGWFTENSNNLWIGKVQTITKGGVSSMAIAYASSQYGASCMLLESIAWSPRYGSAQNLWAMDYYLSIVLEFVQSNNRLN